MKLRTIILISLSLLTFTATVLAKPAIPSWRDAHPWSTEVATVQVGDVTVQAEIADTPALQSRGLGYRDELLPGTGMLFDFPSTSVHTFWMKGMRFCLDIIWIENGEITGAAENVCPFPELSDAELPRYSSEVPVSYVLEVPAGWMAEHGFGAGTRVIITPPDQPGD